MICNLARSIDEVSLCTSCRGERSAPIYYCSKHCSVVDHETRNCQDSTHVTCFEAHLPPTPSVRAIHRPVDAVHHWCINQITYSAEDYHEQQEYHRNDQRAEWFRVEPTPWTSGAESSLQVSQRFDKIWRAAYPIGRAQYPSFVSFMGNTGVGKSTLVRAMMMTGVLENMREKALATGSADSSANWLNFDYVIECRARGPVTRPGLADLASVATSVGVHLYHDPVIAKVNLHEDGKEDEAEDVSLLFADCEGFYGDRPTATGGTTLSVPNKDSETLSKPSQPVSRSRKDSAASSSTGPSPSSSAADEMTEEQVRDRLRYQEIPIRAPSLRGRGKAGSELFYARYLYAFSDVLVFVTKSPQSLGSELGDFLTWIARAEKHSIPPRSPRTLVIVINRNDYHSPQYYSETYLKEKMFAGLGDRQIWEASDELNALKEDYDKEYITKSDRITNNDKFFRLFFQDVRICYVPENAKDTAENQYHQYKVLRDMVMTGSKKAQLTRSERWSRYDVPTVSQLLDKAFWHYATRDAAFDFHAAAGKDNPTPISLSGHIANLLRHTGTDKYALLRFADVVASCLITYEYRSSIHAREPDQNFTTELGEHCRKGVELFQSKFLKCAFRWFDGTLCTTRGFEHDDRHGHRHLDRMVIRGAMDLSMFESSLPDLVQQIRRRFVMMYEYLHVDGRKPTFEALQAFRRTVLGFEPEADVTSVQTGAAATVPEEFQHPSGYFVKARSNKTCFSCLQAAPDHFLPCGHGYCADCVKDFGRVSSHARYVYRFQDCVLCGTSTEDQFHDYEIRLEPRASGVRLLTLDGGGIRGVVTLQLLKLTMDRVNLEIPVMELFDLIVGTSTGGIIALGLGTATSDDLTLQDMLDSFTKLAKFTFEKDRLWFISKGLSDLGAKIGYGLLFIGILSSRYPSRPRREALQEFFTERGKLFGFAPVRASLSRGTRVSVTASSKVACTFANYSRNFSMSHQIVDQLHLGTDRGFIREDNPANEPLAWEAAMATSAAPGYFVPWKIDRPDAPLESRREFTDGAIQANMPLQHALLEKDYIWPSSQGPRPLDITVSVGTGFSRTQLSLPGWLKIGNVQEMIKVYHDNVLNSESMWQKFKDNTTGFRYRDGINYRLNVEIDRKVDMDDWKQMPALQEATTAAYNSPDTGMRSLVDDIAFEMVGKLFFFEPERCVAQAGNRKEYIKGQIWTRLDCSKFVAASRSLLWRIRGFHHLEGSNLEQMQPVTSFYTTDLGLGHSRRSWDQIQQRMNQHPHLPFSLSYNIERTVDLAIEQSVFVELLPSTGSAQSGRRVRISGFPISYGELLGTTQKRRGVQEYPQ